ncbi:MAG: hypothetical protein M1834_005940 [Cirrosporium novae-zelandiae]|nr:MAG: hypothetical protein M1834_005940 [Cirrosporium novae-zelandiae]
MSNNFEQTTLPYTGRSHIFCENCGERYMNQKNFLRHIRPYVSCPKRGCPKEFRKDKVSTIRKHFRDEHPELEKGDVDKFLEEWTSRPWPVIKNLCKPKDYSTKPNDVPVPPEESRLPQIASGSETNSQWPGPRIIENSQLLAGDNREYNQQFFTEFETTAHTAESVSLSNFGSFKPSLEHLVDNQEYKQSPPSARANNLFSYNLGNNGMNASEIGTGNGGADSDVDLASWLSTFPATQFDPRCLNNGNVGNSHHASSSDNVGYQRGFRQ